MLAGAMPRADHLRRDMRHPIRDMALALASAVVAPFIRVVLARISVRKLACVRSRSSEVLWKGHDRWAVRSRGA